MNYVSDNCRLMLIDSKCFILDAEIDPFFNFTTNCVVV
jgi:hypothetical protein